MSSFRPPSLLEIFLFPIAGVLITESVRTRHNELVLLTIPLFLVFIRLAWASAKAPKSPGGPGWEKFERLAKRSIETEQIAAVFLLLFEIVAVFVLSPGDHIADAWANLVPIYAVYVSFRLLARWQWSTTQLARPKTAGSADH